MIWASFGWAGKGSICFVDGRMNSNGYGEMLKNYLVDIDNSIDGSVWIFQEDNVRVHRSNVNIIWFKSKKSNVCSFKPNREYVDSICK